MTIHPAVHCRTHNVLFCDSLPVGTSVGLPGVNATVQGTRGPAFPFGVDAGTGLATHLAGAGATCLLSPSFLVRP